MRNRFLVLLVILILIDSCSGVQLGGGGAGGGRTALASGGRNGITKGVGKGGGEASSQEGRRRLSFGEEMLAGACARAAAQLIMFPADAAKTLRQVDSPPIPRGFPLATWCPSSM